MDDMMDEMSVWFSQLPGTRDNQGFKLAKPSHRAAPSCLRKSGMISARGRPVGRSTESSLLGKISPTNPLKLPKNVRLKAIVKSQPELPLALLFQHPLAEEELEEIARQRRDEENADRARGILEQHIQEDEVSPLPARIQSVSLPRHLGWMRRSEIGAKYVYFTTNFMDKGTNKMSLFSPGNYNIQKRSEI